MASKVDPGSSSLVPLWRKLARASAWALLATVIILLVSGWGITQTGVINRLTFGLVNRRLADEIHRSMNGPLAAFFLSHVLINIKVGISPRSPARNWLMNIILLLIGAGLMAAVIYLEYFRRGG